MHSRIAVVTRSFQIGATEETFDKELFEAKVAQPIERFLSDTGELIQKIVVVTNADPKSQYAEEVSADGTTPTLRAIAKRFGDNDRIVAIPCTEWGANVGSGNALNVGNSYIFEHYPELTLILEWSLEIDVTPRHLYRAIDMMFDRPAVQVVGFYRESWWERTQWNVVQNTAALYRADILKEMGGFDVRCDGSDGVTVMTKKYGEVLRAGMEDFHFILRLMKKNPEYRHGIIGVEAPLSWGVDFEPGSERERNHLRKVARQYAVMNAWADEVFPDLETHEVLNRYFSTRVSQ